MNKKELRSIAQSVRTAHGANSFAKALDLANRCRENGDIDDAQVWNEIAAEISELETSDKLERCLHAAGYSPS
jgi:hypothetical protein